MTNCLAGQNMPNLRKKKELEKEELDLLHRVKRNLSEIIKNNNNIDKKTVWSLKEISIKICNATVRLDYLYENKNNNLIPKHIKDIVKKVSYLFDKEFLNNNYEPIFIKKLPDNIINSEIKHAHWKLNKLNKELELKINNIYKQNCLASNNVDMHLKAFREAYIILLKMKLNNKLLLRNKREEIKIKNKNHITNNKNKNMVDVIGQYNRLHENNWIINLTNFEIPVNVKNFFSLGLNFSVNNIKIDKAILKLIVDVENSLRCLKTSENHVNALRGHLIKDIMNFQNKIKNKTAYPLGTLEKQIMIDAKKTKKFLKDNPHLLICKTDKSSLTVILTKEMYENKMEEHLQNNNIYRRIRCDLKNKLKEITKEYQEILKKLLKKKYITMEEKTKLNINSCRFARMYGLIKAHKENYPIRPIMDGINSPTEKITKFLNPSLNYLNNNNNFDCKNAVEFKEKLKNMKLEEGEIMISFDIQSLFTSIPLNDIFKILQSNWDNIEPFTNIKCKNTFLDVIKFCCNNNYFLVDNKLYRVLQGLPMGGSMSVNLSGIFVNELLNKVLNKIHDKPKFICKYIDDLFLIIKKEHCDNLLLELNNYNKNIIFTKEEEKNGILNYLDVTVIREKNGNITTKWFEKDIKKKFFLNFNSNHPFYQKKNTVFNLIHRAFKLTDPVHLPEIKVFIYEKLTQNMYPKKLINSLWFKVLNSRDKRKNKELETQIIPHKYQSLTYIKGLTEKISRTFKKFDCFEIKFGIKPQNKIKNSFFSRLKDKVPKEEEMGCVYAIPCVDCNLKYIGESRQTLQNRLMQHEADVRNKNTKTALAIHAVENEHKMNFNETKILEKEMNNNKRKLLEAVHISYCDNNMNFKTDTKEINKFYSGIFKEIVLKK